MKNMTSEFSQKVSQIMAMSREEACRLHSPYVGPEHLLLGMLRAKSDILNMISERASVDMNAVKNEVENFVLEHQVAEDKMDIDINLNEQAMNILKLSVLEARMLSSAVVDEEHLFLALLHDKRDNGAKEILEQYNMNYKDTKDFLLKKDKTSPRNSIDMPEEDEEELFAEKQEGSKSKPGVQTRKTLSKTPMVDNFGTDLTAAAAEGKLDPVVGREKEIERVVEILSRRKKNNPVLIGEPGVGKSAIAEGLALQIVAKTISPVLYDKRIISLDMAGIVAGTKYRGQFEERIKVLLKELEENPDIIVFIDEIHTLIGAGSAPGSMDAANLMKPALARGLIQCIGATTLDEYRKSIEKDGALERRFQKVLVEPTTTEQTETILFNVKDRYESHHHVRYSDDAIRACVKLTDRYVSDRQFPDKAIDVMDEVGAKVHLRSTNVPPELIEAKKELETVKKKKQSAVKNQNFELAASFRDRQMLLEKTVSDIQEAVRSGETIPYADITETDVANVVSQMTGIPVNRISESEGNRLKEMSEKLMKDVVAQDNAIRKVVKAIQRNRLGLRDPHHPIAAFMFLGPTGVGKTYLAKKLAEYMFGDSDSIIRVDMSEYSESFNTSRLVGAPPGYVGYDEGGQLTEKVRRHPYSIVLLDEIEKAHGNVFNMLLQVLDEGRLTDGNGRLVDFSNTVIIMTSNAGTRQLKDFGRGIGFNAGGLSADMNDNDKEYARSVIQKSLSKQFSPEFLNRLDEIITFDQLDLNAIKKIVDIELVGLVARLKDMGYGISLTDEAKSFVAKKGYDVQYGARPLKRAIQNYVEDGICELMLSHELKEGNQIIVDKKKGKEELDFDVK